MVWINVYLKRSNHPHQHSTQLTEKKKHGKRIFIILIMSISFNTKITWTFSSLLSFFVCTFLIKNQQSKRFLFFVFFLCFVHIVHCFHTFSYIATPFYTLLSTVRTPHIACICMRAYTPKRNYKKIKLTLL